MATLIEKRAEYIKRSNDIDEQIIADCNAYRAKLYEEADVKVAEYCISKQNEVKQIKAKLADYINVLTEMIDESDLLDDGTPIEKISEEIPKEIPTQFVNGPMAESIEIEDAKEVLIDEQPVEVIHEDINKVEVVEEVNDDSAQRILKTIGQTSCSGRPGMSSIDIPCRS